jgi:hypothetical protein
VVEEDGEEQQEEEGVGAEGQRNGVRDAAPVANGKQQKGGTGRPPGRTRKNGSESTLPPVSYVGRQQPVRPQPSGSVAPTPHAARVLNQETARLRQLAQVGPTFSGFPSKDAVKPIMRCPTNKATYALAPISCGQQEPYLDAAAIKAPAHTVGFSASVD